MLDAENTYGIRKRFEFVEKAIAAAAPASILDIGCGAGTYLTQPVAARFPGVRIVGVDSDAASVAYAQAQHARPNLEFRTFDALRPDERFDMVIASEVIEHVEDPVAFLQDLRGRLNPGGRLLLTLPNGYGPFEMAQLAHSVLDRVGLPALLRRRPAAGVGGDAAKDTLADSPHINFFSLSRIRSLLAGTGFRVVDFKPRTFLCGWGFDRLLRDPRLIGWNARIAERLPRPLASGWMFTLAQDDPAPLQAYRRNGYARLRRRLNERAPAGPR